jgi:uncharacterized protein (DUF488 family)
LEYISPPTDDAGVAFVKLRQLSTIGYEGVSIDAFIATLKAAKVTLLLDVRELPISRRRGFSKTALSSISVLDPDASFFLAGDHGQDVLASRSRLGHIGTR